MPPISRSTFLRTVAAAGAAAFLDHRSFAAPPAIGLGFSLYGMNSLPIGEAIQACAKIGYESVELALLDGFPTEPTQLSADARRQLREQLAAARVRVAGLMDNLSLVADAAAQAKFLERIKRAAELAHTLVPEAPPVLETVLGGKPAEWEQIKDRMAEALRGWAAAAAEAKLVIAIKAHVMSATQTPERLLWLLGQADSLWIKAAYDFSHFQAQGLDLAATLDALLPHTRFLHVKDGRQDAEGKVEFLLPGEGTTDYRALFAALRTRGFTGDAVVEVSGQIWKRPDYDPVRAAQRCFEVLNSARG